MILFGVISKFLNMAFLYRRIKHILRHFCECAYGLPLAAHVKRQGKKAIHLAGSLQLLFGIKGKRWENPNYNPLYNYSELMNEHWVYANDIEKPKNAHIVEGACYW